MKLSSPYYWTDMSQATERLVNSYLLYGPDVVQVINVDNEVFSTDGSRPVAVIKKVNETLKDNNKAIKVRLDDPLWNSFKSLPPLGWVNNAAHKTAFYIERNPKRNSKSHGLITSHVEITDLSNSLGFSRSSKITYDQIAKDRAYMGAIQKDFPPLDLVLLKIHEGKTLAISPTYGVFRDERGVKWLFRKKERIGIFIDASALCLLKPFAYLKEELESTSCLSGVAIKEF